MVVDLVGLQHSSDRLAEDCRRFSPSVTLWAPSIFAGLERVVEMLVGSLSFWCCTTVKYLGIWR